MAELKRMIVFAVCTMAALTGLSPEGTKAEDIPRVIWYGTLKGALAEAKRSDRPILLLSAAPHCHAVSGVW